MNVPAVALILTAALGVAHAGLPKVPPLASGGRFAVAGFGMDRSIVMAGAERDQGPGLVQDPVAYFKTHQGIVDSMWTIFRDTMPTLFAGVDMLPLDSMVSDASYQEASQCVPKKVFGKVVLACQDLEHPAGPNSIVDFQNPKLASWAQGKGLKAFFVVRNKVEYFLSAGAGVNGLVAGAGKMRVETTIYLVEPGKKAIWIGGYKNESESSTAMVGDLYPESKWSFALEAFRANLAKFAADVEKGKTP